MEIVGEIIEILVSGLAGIASGIGSGLNNLVTDIFLVDNSGTVELSTFGTVIVVFAGVSLAIGLCTLVVHWLTSLGASRGM